jgi:AbrB family looped-hinge helix DNA binding protein
MKASIITVTAKGQITLPTNMRTATGIKTGDKLLVIESKKRLVLQKVTEDDFADLKKHSSEHMAKFWSNPKDDI